MPGNVSRHLKTRAARHPDRTAVILANGDRISFAQLDAECDRFASHFAAKGIRPGDKVAVFVRPGFELVPTLFGCFRLGAIPVCIDPGMKLRNLLTCVKEAKPDAVVGVPIGVALSLLFARAFGSARTRVCAPKVVPGKFTRALEKVRPTSPDEIAAILFTSGSTGIPKGVVYSHDAFDHQQRLLREAYAIGEDEVDLVVFPLFALFAAAWGITAVIPKMNPARPAKTSGRHLASLIRTNHVTHTAGSPAIWRNLATYCHSHRVTLPSLKRILMAGAQVPEQLVRACADLAKSIHTPYGATEALPLTTISQTELFELYGETRRGAGTCVGRALPGVDIAVIPFLEGRVAVWDESLRQPPHVKGEIAVRAAWVTKEYFRQPGATDLCKITSDAGVWHRMGDVGYLDEENRLWFCGRKDHRIFFETTVWYPDPLEAIFDGVPSVRRSAVVGVGLRGRQRPVLVLEGKDSPALRRDLIDYAKQFPETAEVETVAFTKKFPVDVRHNIKIDRLRLAEEVGRSL